MGTPGDHRIGWRLEQDNTNIYERAMELHADSTYSFTLFQMLMSVIRSPILFLFLGLFCLYVRGQQSSSANGTVQPIASVDLRTFGYVVPRSERERREYEFLKYSVAFIDDETLTVSFFKKNDHPGLSRRDGTPGAWLVFHTIMFDVNTGRVRAEHTWGNEGYANAFLPLASGNVFVQDDEWLMVYSKELQEVARKKKDVSGDIPPRYSISPNGRSLWEFQDAYDSKRGWLTRITQVDAATLKGIQSKVTPGHGDETASDEQVVYSVLNPGNELALFAYRLDGSVREWSPRLLDESTPTAQLVSRSGCNSPRFISNSVLAVTGNCSWLILLKSGQEIAEVHAPEYRFGGEIEPSRNGRRFAFARSQNKGNSSLSTKIELVVYDLKRRKDVFVASITPLPQHKIAFSLSPDGSLLAVQADTLLRIWRLKSFR